VNRSLFTALGSASIDEAFLVLRSCVGDAVCDGLLAEVGLSASS